MQNRYRISQTLEVLEDKTISIKLELKALDEKEYRSWLTKGKANPNYTQDFTLDILNPFIDSIKEDKTKIRELMKLAEKNLEFSIIKQVYQEFTEYSLLSDKVSSEERRGILLDIVNFIKNKDKIENKNSEKNVNSKKRRSSLNDAELNEEPSKTPKNKDDKSSKALKIDAINIPYFIGN